MKYLAILSILALSTISAQAQLKKPEVVPAQKAGSNVDNSIPGMWKINISTQENNSMAKVSEINACIKQDDIKKVNEMLVSNKYTANGFDCKNELTKNNKTDSSFKSYCISSDGKSEMKIKGTMKSEAKLQKSEVFYTIKGADDKITSLKIDTTGTWQKDCK